MKISYSWFIFGVVLLNFSSVKADIIRVPADFATIQEGINAALDSDTVLVAPGHYYERIILSGKTITLGSWFLTAGDTSYIPQTIIDGGGRKNTTAVTITNTVGAATTVIGFTIKNADDGIAPKAKFRLLNNHIVNCNDGIDYEQFSGGICRFNVFENNRDDGIDLDDFTNIVIEDNIIRNNEDDGVEIRLHQYSGPLLTYIIRRNLVYGNGEDGIQLIDYPDTSDRVFYIEHNLIYDNAMAGLGCMSRGNTKENYEGASIPEPVYLINNTFVNNNHGVTGGDNMVALNNLIAHTEMTAMKNVNSNSIVSHSLFWQNGLDFENVNKDTTNLFFNDPRLDEKYRLTEGSPCIDSGTAFFYWQGDTVLNLSSGDYIGTAPDIGAFEFDPDVKKMILLK